MAFPVLPVTELRARLDVSADQLTDEQLQHFIDVATAYWNPRVDESTFPGAEPAYREGIYQAAVKVASTANVGPVSVDPSGVFEYSNMATSGLMRTVLGVIQPCLKSGGVVIA